MDKIKVGVFGGGRGRSIAENFMLLNADIVAVCDSNPAAREKAAQAFGQGVAVYDNFDAFLDHGMDAVILANFFHEHAPYAIRCLERGIHVYSECLSNGTMAEGVALIRAAEKSKAVYMLAENYPGMCMNLEMQRICREGSLGKILYAEGEYNHPFDYSNPQHHKDLSPFPKHWRNWLPRTYYITHTLGPLMRATGATPRRVTAFAAFAPFEGDVPSFRQVGDRAANITIQNDDGSIYRVGACSAYGGHHVAYRICGTKGSVESLRHTREILLRYNDWEKPEGAEEVSVYEPEWHDKDAELIKNSGHGGGDYIIAREFLDCIREGHQPAHPFDVHSAVTMASTAILAHRSVLANGQPFDIPDFHTESARKAWENDHASPFWGSDGTAPTLPCSSHTEFRPTDTQVRLFHELVMGEKV